jgi:hypothetical protein
MCTPADAPFPPPTHDTGYKCAFGPSMLSECLDVFDAVSTDVSAYTEMVIDAGDNAFAIEAIVGDGGDAAEAHARLLARFGLNERQCPRLAFGSGLKDSSGPLFVDL